MAALWRLALVAVWLGVIFMASTGLFTPERTGRMLTPVFHWLAPRWRGPQLDEANYYARKAGHVCEYAALAALLAWTTTVLLPAKAKPWWFAVWLAVVFLVACSDEFHQMFVPERTASGTDVALDTLAGLFTLGVIAVGRDWWLKRRLAKGAASA